MHKTKIISVQSVWKIVVIYIFFHPAMTIATPANQDNLRVHTGTPRRTGDSLFSITTEWRIDEALTYRSTGMLFLKGPDKKKTPTATKVAKSMVSAIKDSMVQLYPGWRGANPHQTPDQPELTISNKEGFSFTAMTVKDYANQILTYDLPDNQTFAAAGIDVAIDLVLASAVENIQGFTIAKPKANEDHGQANIKITIDDKTTSIDTKGKNTQQIEKALASALANAQFNSSPLFPNIKDGDTRNNKPFDGGEVQLNHFSGKSLTIEINEPTLGVLTKFKYRDDNTSHNLFDPASMFKYGAIAIALIGGFLWYSNNKNKQA